MANWNAPLEYKIRHGQPVRIIKRENLPEWLIKYNKVLFVIIEHNQLPNGQMQIKDGPTKDDIGEDWIIATAHFGPPSNKYPRIPKKPKDISKQEDLEKYIKETEEYNKELKTYYTEKDHVVFVDLEKDGQVGLAKYEKTNGKNHEEPIKEINELKMKNCLLEEQFQNIFKEFKSMQKQLQELRQENSQLRKNLPNTKN